MKINADLTDAVILQTLGQRLAQHRLRGNLTQAELAERAGIAKRTLERVEAGHGAELTTLVRILRALRKLEVLEQLIPELPPSPIAQVELRGKQRQRASGARTKAPSGKRKPWTWGET